MLYLCVAIACLIVFVLWRDRPVRCLVGDVRLPLVEALRKLRSSGEGFVILDAGQNFMQFCLRPDDRVMIIDVPGPQFGDVPVGKFFREAGFSLRDTGPVWTYEREVATPLEAAVVVDKVIANVFVTIFGLNYTDTAVIRSGR